MGEILRIAGISDTHFGATSSRHRRNGIITYREFRQHVRDMSKNADVIVHCGDFTDRGDEPSLKTAASILSESYKPVIGVLGNHDIRQDPAMAREILSESGGITLLEGNSVSIPYDFKNISFTGLPGFAKRKEGQFIRHLRISQEEYDDMVARQASTFRKEIRCMKGQNNVVLFHFDQLKAPALQADGSPGEEILASDFIKLVDQNARKIKLLLHGHDHRNIDRPLVTPGNVDVIDLAVPILIKMHPGIPYRIINLPLS